MLQKLDWQHYALAIAGFLVIFLPELAKLLADMQVPAGAAVVLKIASFATMLLALVKQFASASSQASQPASKQAGFAVVHLLAAISAGVIAFALACTASGCTPGAQAVVQDVGQTALCVDDAVYKSVAAGQTTFEDIAMAVVNAGCGPIAVATVEEIIKLLMPSASPAMAAKLAAVHHKAAK